VTIVCTISLVQHSWTFGYILPSEHVILPDCMYLSDEGEVDCTRAVLQLAKQNLNDSFLPYGGANTYWAAAMYLALRGDIVGDIRRGDSYLSDDEDIWMSESVSYLFSERLIDASAADRLLHRGKWESCTPPLPRPDQRYLIDMFCGGMSLYHNCLQYTDLACVTIDYQRSIKRKSSDQTCRYVRPHLIMDIRHADETAVETALQQLHLQGPCLLHVHASPRVPHTRQSMLPIETGVVHMVYMASMVRIVPCTGMTLTLLGRLSLVCRGRNPGGDPLTT
jgi:hypothetical protein